MRGCNGYDRVIQVVETLKDEVPLSLMFCLSPWNSFDDMAFVIDIATHWRKYLSSVICEFGFIVITFKGLVNVSIR